MNKYARRTIKGENIMKKCKAKTERTGEDKQREGRRNDGWRAIRKTTRKRRWKKSPINTEATKRRKQKKENIGPTRRKE